MPAGVWNLAIHILCRPPWNWHLRERVRYYHLRLMYALFTFFDSFESLQVKSIAKHGLKDWVHIDFVLDHIHDYVFQSAGTLLPLTHHRSTGGTRRLFPLTICPGYSSNSEQEPRPSRPRPEESEAGLPCVRPL